MLTRDYSYQIYRSLYSCLEVTETTVEATVTETEAPAETKTDEQTEPMITSGDDSVLPGLDLVIEGSDLEDNERKRKRSPSKVNHCRCFACLHDWSLGGCIDSTQEIEHRRKFNDRDQSIGTSRCPNSSTHHSSWIVACLHFLRSKSLWLSGGERCRRDSAALRPVIDEERGTVRVIWSTRSPHLVLSPRPNCSSVVSHTTTRFHTIGWPIKSCRSTRPPTRINWSWTRRRSTPPHRKVSEEFRCRRSMSNDEWIGNLLLLPNHVSVFGVHSAVSNESNSLVTSVDSQRAMKQLELSNKVQTGLELKIDTMKKEISKFNCPPPDSLSHASETSV